MKIAYIILGLTALLSCGSKSANNKDNKIPDPTNPEIVSKPYILLDNEHSMMKNKSKDVPYYYIPNLDSFTVDITGYEFILPSPEFDYIRDGINYPEMLGGSWAYIDILYGDSGDIYTQLNELEKDKKFAIANFKDRFKGEKPKEFILAFRFYIDNAAGQQEIDHFKVKVGQ